ncbi:MAG: hypothetical protein KKD44_25985, partial [Proteobacteria bacterium]|nr:hypothetical protein [Pseudomonadota bacterium]
MKILIGTNWISEDEPCFELYEQDVQSPDSSGFHRYEVYRVMRGGRITEFRQDKGSVEKYRGIEPLVILGGLVYPDGRIEILETVGRMREMADQYRNHIHFDNKELAEVDNV